MDFEGKEGEDKNNNERVTGLGILTGVSFSQLDSDSIHAFKNGIFIIPRKIIFRFSLDKDQKFFQTFYPDLTHHRDLAILELPNSTEKELLTDFNLIDKSLITFRLIKKGPIKVLHTIAILKNTGKPTLRIYGSPASLHFNTYDFTPDIIDRFRAIFPKIDNLEKDSSLKVAIDRFNMYYTDVDYANKLVDLCIGFEALFTKGERYNPRGEVVGLACSMLLGYNSKERRDIFNRIKNAFILRNKVVHGTKLSENQIKALMQNIPLLEELLRASILKLLDQ